MIVLLGHVLAAFVDLIRRSASDVAENEANRTAKEEEAKAEQALKTTLFSGYRDFVCEKLEEFSERLTSMETKVPNDSEVVNGAIGILEKSFENLKQSIEYGDVALKNVPQQTIADMERRVAALRRKTETALAKATAVKNDIQSISNDFAPLKDKWGRVKTNLMNEAQPINEAASLRPLTASSQRSTPIKKL